MPDQDKEWFNPSEAATFLGVARATLYKLMDEGKLPFQAVAGVQKRRIRRADLEALLTPPSAKARTGKKIPKKKEDR